MYDGKMMRVPTVILIICLIGEAISAPLNNPEYKKQLKALTSKHEERLEELFNKYNKPLKVFEEQIKEEIKDLKKNGGSAKEISSAQRDFDNYKNMADEVYNDRKKEINKWFKRDKTNLLKYWTAVVEQQKEDARLRQLEKEARLRDMKAQEEFQKKNSEAEQQTEKPKKKSRNDRRRNGRRDRRRQNKRRQNGKKY